MLSKHYEWKASSSIYIYIFLAFVLQVCILLLLLPGRVGVEPQVRGSEEHPVVVFSLATNFRYKKGEEYMSSTDWHNVAVFKPSLRESVHQNVSKGHFKNCT